MLPDKTKINWEYGQMPVFFTFEQGQMGYDCSLCKGLCCRHAGSIYLTADQEDLLPKLGGISSVLSRENRVITVWLGYGGCPMYRDGKCSFHVRLGRNGKPVLCAVYPLSRFVVTDSFLAVSPNFTHVCPIQINPNPGANILDYETLITDLNFFFKGSLESFKHVHLPARDPIDIDSEAQFLHKVNRCLDYPAIHSLQAATAGLTDEELFINLQKALSLIERDVVDIDAAKAARLAPLLPTMRTYFFDLPSELVTMSVGIACQLVAFSWNTAQEDLTLRNIFTTVTENTALISLLAQAKQPVYLAEKHGIVTSGSSEVQMEQMLILSEIRKNPKRRTLVELLNRYGENRGIDRILLLRSLSIAGLQFEY